MHQRRANVPSPLPLAVEIGEGKAAYNLSIASVKSNYRYRKFQAGQLWSRVSSLMVKIAAFQAVDPSSILG